MTFSFYTACIGFVRRVDADHLKDLVRMVGARGQLTIQTNVTLVHVTQQQLKYATSHLTIPSDINLPIFLFDTTV